MPAPQFQVTLMIMTVQYVTSTIRIQMAYVALWWANLNTATLS